jgi:NADH-quinone oxidoreductase subunit E
MNDVHAKDPQPGDGRLTVQTSSTTSGRVDFRTSVDIGRAGDPSVFDDTTRAEAAEIIARYPAGEERSALLPMLHLVQSVQGHVSPDGIAFCAEQIGLSKAQVAAVATYYTMFKRKPNGEYLVSVCTNTLCGMLGGDDIYAALREQLGLGHDPGARGAGDVPPSAHAAHGADTTPDGRITIEHAECLAACDFAPVVTVNYEYFDNQTVGSARNIVSQLQSGERPLPSRGAPLCSFKEISRQIAGFFDAETFAPDAVSSGAPTERGVTLAIERGESAPSFAAGNGRAGGEAAEHNARRSSQQPTSSHDAPLTTSGSDDAHPAKPATDGEGK